MITCIINNRTAVPQTGTNIKVTFENPLIKDRDAQTMEITFPLSIKENLAIFGSVGRIDVARHTAVFNSCRLYADNRLVIEGKGTVMNITDTAVKFQIKAGKGVTDIDEDWDKVYIDRLYYPTGMNGIVSPVPLLSPDVAIFTPVYNEETSTVLNAKAYTTDENGVYLQNSEYIVNQAPQPNLAFVLKTVLARMGYTLDNSVFNRFPWNRLYIANANITPFLKACLPHWTVKKFLDEVKKLFNIGFVFRDADKRVTMDSTQTSSSQTYECIDELSTDYEEEGLAYTGSSNLAYNLSDSEAWDNYPDISEEILSQFTVYEDTSQEADRFRDWDDKRLETTIFHRTFNNMFPYESYSYCKVVYKDGTRYTEFHPIAQFQHLTRQKDGSTVELNIVPCPLRLTDVETRFYKQTSLGNDHTFYSKFTRKANIFIPSTTGSGTDEDETDLFKNYVTVEDALDGETTEDDAAERMEIYFCLMQNDSDYKTVNTDVDGIVITYPLASNDGERASLRLHRVGDNAIGSFHPTEKYIENRFQTVIKFLADDLPDPKQLFVFRGKRFVCDKLEATVTDTGISRLWTGYFYELNS